MIGDRTARPVAIWVALMSLTLVSVLFAERIHWGSIAIVAMFMIAGVKGELVVAHYMEVGRALPHWRVAYRVWLVAVTFMLTVAHLIS
jgi:uncharacterized membrane protein